MRYVETELSRIYVPLSSEVARQVRNFHLEIPELWKQGFAPCLQYLKEVTHDPARSLTIG